jgi:hypothetical protein
VKAQDSVSSEFAMGDDYRDWVGVDDEGALEGDDDVAEEDDDGDGIEEDDGDEMDGPIAAPIEEHELLDHVEELLNRGNHLSTIAMALGLSRKVLARRLYALGWTGVYHTLTPKECRDAILSVVPLDRAGCNWGVRHVQSMLRRELRLRVPRQHVWDVLHAMQPGHMRWREVRALFQGQYDVTEPMVLWHMDCEFVYPEPYVHELYLFEVLLCGKAFARATAIADVWTCTRHGPCLFSSCSVRQVGEVEVQNSWRD